MRSDFSSQMAGMREDFNRQIEALNRRMDGFEKAMAEMREDFNRQMAGMREDFNGRMEELRGEFSGGMVALGRRVEDLYHLVTALGSRWGLASESAFREGMRGILEERGFTVERWEAKDREGVVFGVPSVVEVDLLIKDRRHLLLEIKSSVSRGDVAVFLRKASLYQKLEGVKPQLAIITPFITPKAKELARERGIKIYTTAREL